MSNLHCKKWFLYVTCQPNRPFTEQHSWSRPFSQIQSHVHSNRNLHWLKSWLHLHDNNLDQDLDQCSHIIWSYRLALILANYPDYLHWVENMHLEMTSLHLSQRNCLQLWYHQPAHVLVASLLGILNPTQRRLTLLFKIKYRWEIWH